MMESKGVWSGGGDPLQPVRGVAQVACYAHHHC